MKFKVWESFTNGVITGTIIGIGITWLVQTTYAARYRLWFKSIFIPATKIVIKKAHEIIDNLSKEDKEFLLTLATKYENKTKEVAETMLKLHTNLSVEQRSAIINTGAKKIKDIVKTVIKKI